jgi:hypothetical protein
MLFSANPSTRETDLPFCGILRFSQLSLSSSPPLTYPQTPSLATIPSSSPYLVSSCRAIRPEAFCKLHRQKGAGLQLADQPAGVPRGDRMKNADCMLNGDGIGEPV